jgi:hypothetical protein
MNTIFSVAASSIEHAGRTVERIAKRAARSVPAVQNVVRDTVELTKSNVAVKAGAAVIRTASEVVGTIIDIFA